MRYRARAAVSLALVLAAGLTLTVTGAVARPGAASLAADEQRSAVIRIADKKPLFQLPGLLQLKKPPAKKPATRSGSTSSSKTRTRPSVTVRIPLVKPPPAKAPSVRLVIPSKPTKPTPPRSTVKPLIAVPLKPPPRKPPSRTTPSGVPKPGASGLASTQPGKDPKPDPQPPGRNPTGPSGSGPSRVPDSDPGRPTGQPGSGRPTVIVVPLPPRGPSRPPVVLVDPQPPPGTPPPPPRGPHGSSRPPVASAPVPPLPLPPSGRLPAPSIDPQIVPDEVIVTVDLQAPESVENAVAQQFNLVVLERTPLEIVGRRMVRLRIPDQRAVDAVVVALTGQPGITGPQPNFLYTQQQGGTPSGAASMQYALGMLHLASAHTLATGAGASVAIIDTGVDRSHPALAESRIEQLHAIEVASDDEDAAHGTAIAGIIAARGPMAGIAPGARVISIRAFRGRRAGRPATASTYDLAKAINLALKNQARVLNLSFAGPKDPLVGDAVGAAAKGKAIMIAAAGNNGADAPPSYPAAYADVIAVTAVDARDRLYAKANRGAYIAVAAPGVDIFAPAKGGAFDLQSGTSFAAAHVTGIVALMLERNPDLDTVLARKALMEASADLGAPGHDDHFGAGRVNASTALNLSLNVDAALRRP